MKKRIRFLIFFVIIFGIVGCQKKPIVDEYSNSLNSVTLPISTGIPEKVLSPVPTATQIPLKTATPTTMAVTQTPTPIIAKEPSLTVTPTSGPKYVSSGEYAQTIMIYMVGSDLESAYAAGSYDLLEMLSAEADVTYNNVVIYTGGASQWYIEGLSSEHDSVLLLEEDGLSVIETLEGQNMGRAETLAMFINYCMESFESETYSLILWNHGAGPVFGYGLDEKSNDILSLTELRTALESSVGEQRKNLE